MKTQSQKIVSHFKHFKYITSLQATLNYNITSLHRRLSDLRSKGWEFGQEWQGVGCARYFRYFVISQPEVKL